MNLKPWSEVKILAPIETRSSSPPPSPLPALPEVTGLNTTLNVSSQLMNLDAKECSQRRCSGNGRCVETGGDTVCVCSLAYSGDSCQDHLLKTMQGPIVYGAVGLCAAVAIIAVMAVVVKRRKTIRARFV